MTAPVTSLTSGPDDNEHWGSVNEENVLTK
jgi:hypothetical protein